jgi:hypothetical protein
LFGERASEEERRKILTEVTSTIQGVLSSMHPDVADGLRAKFAEAFEQSAVA